MALEMARKLPRLVICSHLKDGAAIKNEMSEDYNKADLK